MANLLTVEMYTEGEACLPVGLVLTLHPSGEKLLVFADQASMPGFRKGDKFVANFGKTVDKVKTVTIELPENENGKS